ncbi:phage head-tail connector protein [Bacillus atrophaeus]|uniref:phage head-tail connector protein n=1 Tax=Bacillus atrophaeus TaxID=1452 RepID=UPI002DB65DAB|nr:phage head-tail connector protein [Bacillus atrophaeus]MEC1900963.1 phage head-tail connector protein [Bacillus atrophaeus]MED4437300.1 phage head-tail connector protein [Bacillus atrophaeus]MED4567044.1 phage head-tail connector protein [Bacillus atrophaeus]MED4573366.1 phage head-tail connector protein [Bacillus atrophaeus]MED4776493.1 phage head-tail connector protein [Bacillus atrophaeus]
MDIQQVKRMSGITTDKHDAYLSEIVPILIEFASDFCSNKFDPEALPAGVKLFVAKAAEYNMTPTGLSGRSMGDVSYSYNTEFPRHITKNLTPYRRLRVK